MFEIREIRNKTEYNPLLISKQVPFVQAWFYGEWQEMMGRQVRRFELKKDSEAISFFQVIKYPLAFSQNLLYIPHLPMLQSPSKDFLDFLQEKLTQIAKEEKAIFVRFDLYFHNCNYESKEKLGKYFKKVPAFAYHSVYFQPKYEWVLDIDKPESELLGNIDRKNRYNISLAENKGVII